MGLERRTSCQALPSFEIKECQLPREAKGGNFVRSRGRRIRRASCRINHLANSRQMDQILNKVGSYWLGQKANKEINSVGDDFNSLSTSIEGGAKWLVNKLKGKMQKSLPELLKDYDLPVGIFPRDATNYEFNEATGKLTVYIPTVCEVGYRDSSVLRFSTTVTGYLEEGKVSDIEGIKTKMIVWVKVSCISSEKSKINFTAGMKKSRSRAAYEVHRDGVTVEKF